MPEPESEPTSLPEDLLLLSARPQDGKIETHQRITFGLAGAELVALAMLGRIDIAQNRIVLLDAAATGDAELDGALQSIASPRRPPRPQAWVGHPRRGIREAYLARLVSAGVLRTEPGGIFGRTQWVVAAPARAASVRGRLDAIAQSAGQVNVAEAALGGLACAAGLDRVLYPGFGARHVRKRLAQIATGRWTAAPADAAGSAAAAAGSAATSAASAADAATRAAAAAAAQAATQAATDAAVQAAVQASTQAAVAAAVEAAHHAAAAGDAGAHGHH